MPLGICIYDDTDADVLHLEIVRAKNIGCDIVQFFILTMHNTLYNKYKKIGAILKANNMSCIVHISYSINCAKTWTPHSWWIIQCIQEIKLAKIVGAYAVVIHLGKSLDLTIEESINNMFTSFVHIAKATMLTGVKILIETSAGQGTELCYTVESFIHFYDKLYNHNNKNISNRFGICIDTCHIYASGYTPSKYIKTLAKLTDLNEVKLIHLNDSKNKLGSHVDRHENLGKGTIGLTPLLKFYKFFKLLHVPVVLETPEKYQQKDLHILLNT
jgi:deoxyribonuclease IV